MSRHFLCFIHTISSNTTLNCMSQKLNQILRKLGWPWRLLVVAAWLANTMQRGNVASTLWNAAAKVGARPGVHGACEVLTLGDRESAPPTQTPTLGLATNARLQMCMARSTHTSSALQNPPSACQAKWRALLDMPERMASSRCLVA